MRAEIDGQDKCVETEEAIRQILQETWKTLSINRINNDSEKLPHLITTCLSVNDYYNSPA